MSQTKNEGFIAQLGPEQIAFLDNLPTWFAAGGMAAVIFSIIIPIVLVLLLIYARRMTRGGVLR